jgi:hypothetical protein
VRTAAVQSALQQCYRQGLHDMRSADVDLLVSRAYSAVVEAAAAAASRNSCCTDCAEPQ